jgi:hypothetical protein
MFVASALTGQVIGPITNDVSPTPVGAAGVGAAEDAPVAPPPPPSATPGFAPNIPVMPPTLCSEPAPLVKWQDYNAFGRRIDRKAVRTPPFKHGIPLCSLAVKDKFKLFLHEEIDPIGFLSVSFHSALNQAEDQDPQWGEGGKAYAKRWGAEFLGQTTAHFFGDFLYPTIFREDPRYYRLGQGSVKSRLLYAMKHTVIAHHDTGKNMFNYNEFLGTATSLVLANLYHPAAQHGAGPFVEAAGMSIVQDMGFDVLREFWPEVAHIFKLPFRGSDEYGTRPTTTQQFPTH